MFVLYSTAQSILGICVEMGTHCVSFINSAETVSIIKSLPLFSILSSFGMIHDGEGNPCRKTEGNIMSPTLAGNNGVFSWSTCSRQYLSRFLG